MKRQRLRNTLLATAIASLLPAAASAARIDYTIESGYERNDNVTLSETDPVEQNIGHIGLGFALEQNSSAMRASVVGRIDHRRHEDIYGNTTDRMLQGQFSWMAIPDRLTFVVDDSYGVEAIDRYASDSPGNRQQVNVLMFGPNLHFGLGSTLQGQAELRYINSDAEVTEEFDSDRVLAALRAIRQIDTTSSLSFNLQAQNVDFDNDLFAPDHRRYEGFVNYQRKFRKFEGFIDVGYAYIDYKNRESHDDPLLRGEVRWNLSERSTFSANAARQFSDAATSALAEIGSSEGVPPSVVTGSTTINAYAYRETSVGAGYDYSGPRMTLSFHGTLQELDYFDAMAPNETARGIVAQSGYRMGPTVTLAAFATVSWNEFDDAERRKDTNRLYGLGIEKTWSRHWSSSLSWTRYERSSRTALAGFEQNVIYLSMAYRNR